MMSWLRTIANRDEDEGAVGRHAALLASLVLLLVALPVGQIVTGGSPHFPLLLVLVLLAAVLVNSPQRWISRVAAVVGIAAVGGMALGELTGSATARIAAEALGLGLLGFTTLVMFNSLIQTDRVSNDTLVGGICVYLLVGLCFALGFILLTEAWPGSFVHDGAAIVRDSGGANDAATRLLYFSFVTLTTLGYGDVTPATDLAQMIAVSEAIVGQLYLTVFVARLVALYVGLRRQKLE